jgi:hypothetical protein
MFEVYHPPKPARELTTIKAVLCRKHGKLIIPDNCSRCDHYQGRRRRRRLCEF